MEKKNKKSRELSDVELKEIERKKQQRSLTFAAANPKISL